MQEFIKKITQIRVKPSSEITQNQCLVILENSLRALASTELMDNREYTIFARGVESYFPTVDRNEAKEKLEEVVINIFLINSFKYLQIIDESEELESSRTKLKQELRSLNKSQSILPNAIHKKVDLQTLELKSTFLIHSFLQ